MYTKQPKKMIIINILDILRKYTDENHKLSQKEIQDMLHSEYNMKVDRKAVKRNLMNLIDFGYEIEYSETVQAKVRIVKQRGLKESSIRSDFHILRDFYGWRASFTHRQFVFFQAYSLLVNARELIGEIGRAYPANILNHVLNIFVPCHATPPAINNYF